VNLSDLEFMTVTSRPTLCASDSFGTCGNIHSVEKTGPVWRFKITSTVVVQYEQILLQRIDT